MRSEIALLRDAGLRVFQIGGKRDMSTWDWLIRLVKRWDDIEDAIRLRPSGPWFYVINDRGLSEVLLEDQ